MSALWCGGEPGSFPFGTNPTVTTDTTRFRTAYNVRCALYRGWNGGNPTIGNPWPGGAVTSAWISWRCRIISSVRPGNKAMGGVGKSGTNKMLCIGTYGITNETAAKLTLYTYDGATFTTLATESGTALIEEILNRYDMQIVSFGATANVKVYLNGVKLIDFTGDVTGGGMTDFDCCAFGPIPNEFVGSAYAVSEWMVANEDLRAWPGLATRALTGPGTTTDWSNNAYGNINGFTIPPDDSQPVSTNVTGKRQEYAWTALPAGTFAIKGCMTAARMAVSSAPAVTQVKMGYNLAGTRAFGTGSTKTPALPYATLEQLDIVDPSTAVTWLQAAVSGSQPCMESLT